MPVVVVLITVPVASLRLMVQPERPALVLLLNLVAADAAERRVNEVHAIHIDINESHISDGRDPRPSSQLWFLR